MSTEGKKKFIVDVAYLALVLVLGYILLRYALPLLMPFALAFLIAYLLRRPIRFLSRVLHVLRTGWRRCLLVVLAYGVAGPGCWRCWGMRATATVGSLVIQRIPTLLRRPMCCPP